MFTFITTQVAIHKNKQCITYITSLTRFTTYHPSCTPYLLQTSTNVFAHSSRERRLNQGLEAPASFYSQVSLYEIFSRTYLYWLGEKSIRVICHDLHTKSQHPMYMQKIWCVKYVKRSLRIFVASGYWVWRGVGHGHFPHGPALVSRQYV